MVVNAVNEVLNPNTAGTSNSYVSPRLKPVNG